MNRYDRQPQPAEEAVVEYLDGEYRVRKPGAYVRCAVTGEPIPLEDLRYWNVDLQEPYSGPHAKLMRLGVRSPIKDRSGRRLTQPTKRLVQNDRVIENQGDG